MKPQHRELLPRPAGAGTERRSAASRLGSVARRSFSGWWCDNIPRMGAALAYYTLFALAPVLIVAIAVGGLVWGADAVRGEIVGQIGGLIGREGAETIENMLAAAAQSSPSLLVMLTGIATFFLGATGAFLELQAALDTVWRVTPRAHTSVVRDFITQRLISVGLVLGFAFLLLVSLVISAGLNAASRFASGYLPGAGWLWKAADLGISLVVITFVFAMIYKFMPYEELAWRNVWAGALVAAALFVLGKTVLGPYFAASSFISTYGAAGSVIVVLVWVYWSTQILLLGAEVTRAFVQEFGPQPLAVSAPVSGSVGPQRIVARS